MSQITMENKPAATPGDLPDLGSVAIAKCLGGGVQQVCDEIGVVTRFKVLHDTNKPIDKQRLLSAIRNLTVLLSYMVPKYEIAELYFEARKAEQAAVEAAIAEEKTDDEKAE